MIKNTHKILAFACLLTIASSALAQKKSKGNELSSRDVVKFNRLYIDASKAKILSDYEQAIKLYEACTKLDPDQGAPYYELGNLYLNFGEIEEAKENAKKAAEIDRTNFYYRFLYAEILKTNQEFDQVIDEYEKMLKDFPDKIAVYIDLSLVYILKKDYRKAIGAYDRLEKAIGPNEEIKLKKQYLYLQLGETQKACQEIEGLILLEPDDVEYYLLLAEVYYINDLDDKALKAYKRALERFPNNTRVHLSMAEFYKSNDNIDKAFEHIKIAFADPELDVDLKVKSVLSFFDLADRNPIYKKDIYDLGQILLKAHPNDARVLTINGDINLNLNKLREARYYFLRAVNIDNSRYPIWSQLLVLEADLGIYDTLALHSEQAIELFPNQPVCYYFLGFAESRLKKYSEAAVTYNRGISLVINNDALKVQFYLGMADAYNEIGDYKSSDEAFESVLNLDSNNTIALNNYSYYLSERGVNLEKALKMSAKSNKLEPDQSTYLDTYAWIFYKLKRYEDAEIWMAKALKYGGGNSGVILEHMGDILFQLNEIDEAIKYWEKAKIAGEASELLDDKIKDKKLYE